MEVGPCGHVAGHPARLQGGVGAELHGALRGFLLVPGDSPAAGDPIAARPGVDARAEGGSSLRVEAGAEDDAHAGLQFYGLSGFDDVGTRGLQADALLEGVTPCGGAGDDPVPVFGQILVAVSGRIGDVGLPVGPGGVIRAGSDRRKWSALTMLSTPRFSVALRRLINGAI